MQFHVDRVKPVIEPEVRNLCTRPYHNHPHGCPNYGKRDTCPPTAKLFNKVYDLSRPVWALWTSFDLGEHVARMKARHPKWTYRQTSCCLYWQGTVRKFLREHAQKWWMGADVGTLITTCPEAMGINLTATMASIGVKLEWPPKQYTRVIYVAGQIRGLTY